MEFLSNDAKRMLRTPASKVAGLITLMQDICCYFCNVLYVVRLLLGKPKCLNLFRETKYSIFTDILSGPHNV